MSPKRFSITIICLILLAIGLLVWQYLLYRVPDFVKNPQIAETAINPSTPQIQKPIVRSTDPVIGNPKNKTAIVVFSDFQCPYCADMATTLEAVQQKYPDKIKIIWKDAPNANLHPQATAAAAAAHCADEQKQFTAYHDGLFANQNQLADSFYLQLARDLKLNMANFEDCLTSQRWNSMVAANLAEAMALGVDATPYLFIGDQKFSGAISQEELEQIITGQ